jgi:hypothetical protein
LLSQVCLKLSGHVCRQEKLQDDLLIEIPNW